MAVTEMDEIKQAMALEEKVAPKGSNHKVGNSVSKATAKQRAARIRELRRQKAPADKNQGG